jgi:hypothetical protein
MPIGGACQQDRGRVDATQPEHGTYTVLTAELEQAARRAASTTARSGAISRSATAASRSP